MIRVEYLGGSTTFSASDLKDMTKARLNKTYAFLRDDQRDVIWAEHERISITNKKPIHTEPVGDGGDDSAKA